MIYKITYIDDRFLEETRKESMESLNKFYEIGWVYNTPRVIIVDDRKTINLLRQKETEKWVVGWSEGQNIFVLNRDNYETESSHKYNKGYYAATIKHELSHSFFRILAQGQLKPVWLWEGVAIYTSGQDKFKKIPEKFEKFLDSYETHNRGVYDESGVFVQGLVEKFSKQKLLGLVKRLKETKTKEDFDKLFFETYGFNLNYDEINAQKFSFR